MSSITVIQLSHYRYTVCAKCIHFKLTSYKKKKLRCISVPLQLSTACSAKFTPYLLKNFKINNALELNTVEIKVSTTYCTDNIKAQGNTVIYCTVYVLHTYLYSEYIQNSRWFDNFYRHTRSDLWARYCRLSTQGQNINHFWAPRVVAAIVQQHSATAAAVAAAAVAAVVLAASRGNKNKETDILFFFFFFLV